MRSNLERKLLGSKQATLNFQPSFKTEPKEYESIDSGEDASPSSVKSFSSNSTKPNWGDLPNPDMTISGFGKRGKILTVSLYDALNSDYLCAVMYSSMDLFSKEIQL